MKKKLIGAAWLEKTEKKETNRKSNVGRLVTITLFQWTKICSWKYFRWDRGIETTKSWFIFDWDSLVLNLIWAWWVFPLYQRERRSFSPSNFCALPAPAGRNAKMQFKQHPLSQQKLNRFASKCAKSSGCSPTKRQVSHCSFAFTTLIVMIQICKKLAKFPFNMLDPHKPGWPLYLV